MKVASERDVDVAIKVAKLHNILVRSLALTKLLFSNQLTLGRDLYIATGGQRPSGFDINLLPARRRERVLELTDKLRVFCKGTAESINAWTRKLSYIHADTAPLLVNRRAKWDTTVDRPYMQPILGKWKEVVSKAGSDSKPDAVAQLVYTTLVTEYLEYVSKTEREPAEYQGLGDVVSSQCLVLGATIQETDSVMQQYFDIQSFEVNTKVQNGSGKRGRKQRAVKYQDRRYSRQQWSRFRNEILEPIRRDLATYKFFTGNDDILVAHSTKDEDEATDVTCPICLCDMEDGETMLACKHAFHTECINNWTTYKQGATCPLCRA